MTQTLRSYCENESFCVFHFASFHFPIHCPRFVEFTGMWVAQISRTLSVSEEGMTGKSKLRNMQATYSWWTILKANYNNMGKCTIWGWEKKKETRVSHLIEYTWALPILAIKLLAALLSSRGKWSTSQLMSSAVSAKAKLYDSPRILVEGGGGGEWLQTEKWLLHIPLVQSFHSIFHPPLCSFVFSFFSCSEISIK